MSLALNALCCHDECLRLLYRQGPARPAGSAAAKAGSLISGETFDTYLSVLEI
jgi:hypothetical protein